MNTSIENFQIATVVIGRNEGQRLITCLEALIGLVEHIIYVDSGSTDNSLQEAEKRGVICLSLDMSLPFTAARARNAGANYLIQKYPDLSAIQFIDGDCEICSDWIAKGRQFLVENATYAVVCGRVKERFPERSIYNALCDIEWDTPQGDALSCGGIALIRVDAYRQVNGYRDDLIAGEEPEMCFRLRQLGWKVYRFNAEMTLHDAEMTKFSQWWKRAKRGGYAYAASFYLHGQSAEKFKRKEVFSIVFWAGFIPVTITFLSLINPYLLVVSLVYVLQVIKVFIKTKVNNKNHLIKLIYSISIVFAKFPHFLGIMKFVINKVKNKKEYLIEYK